MKKVRLLIFLFILLLCSGNRLEVYAAGSINSIRIFGSNRYATSAYISKYRSTIPDIVILVTGENYPDSLCAAPLAAKYNAPILLTGVDKLPLETKDEINRIKPKKIFIIGGLGAVSKNVENQINKYNIQRVSGSNRYETSVKVAELLGCRGEVFLATGENYPDALSAAAIAASRQDPILLTERYILPEDTSDYLLQSKPVKEYVIGGEGVISNKVKAELSNPDRIGGLNRIETNAKVLSYFNNEINYKNLFVASGLNFPDALSGAPLAASFKSAIVLKDKFDDNTDLINYHLNEIGNLIYLGGEKIISGYDNRDLDFNNQSINPTKYLNINTYDMGNQSCHPKVLYFDTPWNGWKYWMAYTPYPYGDADYENPSIAVSNDGINWSKPDGLINPLVLQPELNYCHYSDPHLVFNEDTNQMELWYRFTDNVNHIDKILRKTTSNGILWSAEKLCFTVTDKFALSPSVIYENGTYKIWYINEYYECMYEESKDAYNWYNEKKVTLNLVDDLAPWHIDVIKTNLGYEMLICAAKPDEMTMNNRILLWASSTDGTSFTNSKIILKPSAYKYAWDSKQIYRSSLIKIGNSYKLYYSAMDEGIMWHIGLLQGQKLDDLIGS